MNEKTSKRKMAILILLLMAALLFVACGGSGGSEESSSEVKVAFDSPKDGETVSSPVQVIMSAQNFTVEEAGEVKDGAGHMHIMIDTPCIAAGEVIPKDDNHRHFGDGSTETELELEPGQYKLCLQAADGAHVALEGEGTTHTISVTVE